MRRLDFFAAACSMITNNVAELCPPPGIAAQVTMLPTADPLAYMLADWGPVRPRPTSPIRSRGQTDKLGASLWSKQRAIAESVVVNRRTAVKSCHGAGKELDRRNARRVVD